MPHGINKDAKEVVARESEYTVNGEYSGILLFKIIVTEAQVDTKSTTTLMAEALGWSSRHDGRVRKQRQAFNQEVRSIQRN
jgi:hypothetical protein